MSGRWSAGTFLAKAQDVKRRLSKWHIERFKHPTRFSTETGHWHLERQTFRHLIEKEAPEHRPESFTYIMPGSWFNSDEDPEDADDEQVIIDLPNPDRDTNRDLTLWEMKEFLRQLNAANPSPALDYLKGGFDQILGLPAWVLYLPRNEKELSKIPNFDDDKPPRERLCYFVTGRAIPDSLLAGLVEGAKTLLAMVPPEWEVVGERPQSPPKDSDKPRKLTETKKAILKLCRSKGKHTGERIAHKLGLTHDHIRRVCSVLVSQGLLKNEPGEGYKTIRGAT